MTGSRNLHLSDDPHRYLPSVHENMNSHLQERFGRRSSSRKPEAGGPTQPVYSMVLNLDIGKYTQKLDNAIASASPSSWQAASEFPTTLEIFDAGRKSHDEELELENNVIVGPYASKEDYLRRHYGLLREDAIAPLRDVVSELQIYPHVSENASKNDAYICDKVYVTGFTFANSGIAARLTFSLGRVGKKIRWEQSKRLRTGTLVALTPANAIFKTVALIAVVAARPIAGLQENPPIIDVFFTTPEQIQFDPQQEWLMVESRNGFFEGHRHVLQGLQMLAQESFPLADHIVKLDRSISPPGYRSVDPCMDCNSIFPTLGDEKRKVPRVVNVTEDLPPWPSSLDSTQTKALQRILGKRLSIIQGPPGTGKTFVSVVALRLMLENMKANDPPIIVSSHTNHALDQLLRHIAKFEPEFVRLGGMSTDLEIIKPRTLYEIKQVVNSQDPKGCRRARALKELRQLTKEIKALLGKLTSPDKLPSPSIFEEYHIISAKQCESLVKGAKQWFDCDANAETLDFWLGEHKVEARLNITPEDFGLELEELDLEIEQMREIEAENKTLDEDDPDSLRGEWLKLSEKWTGKKVPGVSNADVKNELKKQDLYSIPDERRGPVYRYLQTRLKEAIRDRLSKKAKRYAAVTQDAKVGRMEVDYNFIKHARILGLTTSGLAKYRGLLQSVKPKVVLVEEAAETLESYVSVACFDTLEHLILVGDHEQLRGHCHIQDLELDPFYLGISMFERLVRNNIGFAQLRSQRRMIPEIKRALIPVYPELQDHKDVLNRPSVPGMAVNTFFFSHGGPESTDDHMSKMNVSEAELTVGLFVYLVQNGIQPLNITVLTFYNGQRKLILRKLRDCPQLVGQRFKVVTVDSYQGEENEVVLLSLVRSNASRNIGFLTVENRVVVALSRAQRGFYIFGNGPQICKSSTLWWEVLQIMSERPCRVGFHLPLECVNHRNARFVRTGEDFNETDGGCKMLCKKILSCGHVCPKRCHASHESFQCNQTCQRVLSCGHACEQACSDECKGGCNCKAAIESTMSPTLSFTNVTSPYPRLEAGNGNPTQYGSSVTGSVVSARLPRRPPAKGETRNYVCSTFGSVREPTDLDLLRTLDAENAARLFGNPPESESTDDMKLVGRKDDGDGGLRGVWRGTYTQSRRDTDKNANKSLLD